MSTGNEYVSIRSFDNYIYANILLARLKESGIDCYIKDENTITIDPLLSPAIGGMKLMVRTEDVNRISILLDEFENEYLKAQVCPNCGQQAVQRLVKVNRPTNIISAIFYKLFLGSTEQKKVTYKCSYCGYSADDLLQFQSNTDEPEN